MRVANRIIAALLALGLAAALLLGAVEIVLGRLDRDYWIVPWPDWYRTLRTTPWDDTGTRVAFGIVIAVGAILVLLQILRRRPVSYPLEDQPGMAPAVLRRKPFERALTDEALSIDGVHTARARAGRRRIQVQAHTNRLQPKDLEDQLRQTINSRVSSVGFAEPRPVVVELEHRAAPNTNTDGRVE
jgi:hypothetical protein